MTPTSNRPRRIVLTGGPGAGKTAILELVRRALPTQIRVLPESAGIMFGGGFPRGDSPALRRAAQRAIFYTQRELEATADDPLADTPVLCDRGTIDGAAYWPGPGDLWSEVGTTFEAQLARYDAVIHLRTPSPEHGYNTANPLRVESAIEAAAIDERILAAWAGHSRRIVIEAAPDFLVKAGQAFARISEVLRAPQRPSPDEGVAPAAPRTPSLSRGISGTTVAR